MNDNGFHMPLFPVKTLDEWRDGDCGKYANLVALVEETKGE